MLLLFSPLSFIAQLFGLYGLRCYDEVARLIDVVRSSFLPSSNPCLHHIPIELRYINIKEFASSWNKEQLSGSMTRRATASSAVRMGKTFSSTILRFRPMASAACK